MAITLSNDKGQKTSPRNPLGLAYSKTNRSSSESLCDEPRRHRNRVSAYIPEGASGQVQKVSLSITVCQEKRQARGEGKRGPFNPGSLTQQTTVACGEGGSQRSETVTREGSGQTQPRGKMEMSTGRLVSPRT